MAGENPITMETLWERLNLNQNELLQRLTAVEQQMMQMNGSMNALNEQIAEVQMRVSAAEDNLESTDSKVQVLAKRVEVLEAKAEYMENKSRQNNVVIFGISEGEERSDPVAFVQQFLMETLNLPRDNLHIERAHRIPTHVSAATAAGKRPRPTIAKFGNYLHKAKVMKLAREKGTLLYKDTRAFIYQDFSAAVQKKRQLFVPVKSKLYAAGIRYAMIFPAILSVDFMGVRKRFETPLDAQKCLDDLDKSSASSMTS